ncbi:MAG: Hpt domain-containing protein [Planctomycetota bacterium]|jgi:HPt (histidine-containing phosphotransfer) domain-containing protein
MTDNDNLPASSLNQEGSARQQEWAQLMAEYLQDLPRQFDAMRTTLETRDYATIKEQAHRIKGTSGTYGLDSICSSTARLERLAESRNPDVIVAAIDEVMCLIELEIKKLKSSEIWPSDESERNTDG